MYTFEPSNYILSIEFFTFHVHLIIWSNSVLIEFPSGLCLNLTAYLLFTDSYAPYSLSLFINTKNYDVAQWVRALAPKAVGWMFESHAAATDMTIKTGSDSSTAKRSATGASVMGPRRWPLLRVKPVSQYVWHAKTPHCSKAMSTEHRSKFAALHQQCWRLHMGEKFSSETICTPP